VRTALSNARRDRITGLGVEVAFFAALALVPGLLVLVALLGSIEALIGQGLAERAEAVLLDLFRSILTEDAGDALAGVRRLFEEERPGLLTLGIASTLLALVRAFSTVFRALDVVYEVRVPRLWWQRRARAFALAVVTVIVAAVLLAVVVLGLCSGGAGRSRLPRLRRALRVGVVGARVPVTAVVLVGWATLLFSAGALRRSSWRRELPGAVAVAVAWLAASVGLRVFVGLAARSSRVFGVLGGALILLLWLYLLALGLLFGGELNAALGGRGSRTSRTAVVT